MFEQIKGRKGSKKMLENLYLMALEHPFLIADWSIFGSLLNETSSTSGAGDAVNLDEATSSNEVMSGSESQGSHFQESDPQDTSNPAGSPVPLMRSQVMEVPAIVTLETLASPPETTRIVVDIQLPSSIFVRTHPMQYPIPMQVRMAIPEMVSNEHDASVEDIDGDDGGAQINDGGDGWISDEDDEEVQFHAGDECSSDGEDEEAQVNTSEDIEEEEDSSKDTETTEVGAEANGKVAENAAGSETPSVDVNAEEVATSSSALQQETENSRALVSPPSASSVEDENVQSLAQAVGIAPRYAFLARTSSSAPNVVPSSDIRPSTSQGSNEAAQPGPSSDIKPSTSQGSNGSSKPGPCSTTETDPKPCSSKACIQEEEEDTEDDSSDQDTEDESSSDEHSVEEEEGSDEDWTDEQRDAFKPPSDETYHWTNSNWRDRTEQGLPKRERHAPDRKYPRLCLKCGAIGYHKTKRCTATFEEREWYLFAKDLDQTYGKHMNTRFEKARKQRIFKGLSEEELRVFDERVPGSEIRERLGVAERRLQQVIRQLRDRGHHDQAIILGSNAGTRIWILREHPLIHARKWNGLYYSLMSYINGFRFRFQ